MLKKISNMMLALLMILSSINIINAENNIVDLSNYDNISIDNPTKAGYRFLGWSETPIDTDKTVTIYRYRNGKIIPEYNEWSEWSESPCVETDGKKCETKTIYTKNTYDVTGYTYSKWMKANYTLDDPVEETDTQYTKGPYWNCTKYEQIEREYNKYTCLARDETKHRMIAVCEGDLYYTKLCMSAKLVNPKKEYNLEPLEEDNRDFCSKCLVTKSQIVSTDKETGQEYANLVVNGEITRFYLPKGDCIDYTKETYTKIENGLCQVMELKYDLYLRERTGYTYTDEATDVKTNLTSCSESADETGKTTCSASYLTRYSIPTYVNSSDFDGVAWSKWQTTAVSPTTTRQVETKTLYAAWEQLTFSISYIMNGGINNASNPNSYNTTDDDLVLLNPTKRGYTFEGWYSDSALTKQVTKIPSGSTGNKVFYAKWNIITYSIDYVLNDSIEAPAVNDNNPNTYNVENSIVLNTPTRQHYIFDGWYSDSALTNKVTTIIKTVGDKTLYAKWIRNFNYINYDATGGHPTPNSTLKTNNVSTNITTDIPVKTGYGLLGWGEEFHANTNKDSITLYGYKKATYKIENVKTDSLKDTYTPWYKNVYKYDYDYKKTASVIPTNFTGIPTAGATTVWSASTNGKTWHITEVINDVDCADTSYGGINYWQPETELRVNGVKKLQIQKNSSNIEENGHKKNLDIEANGTVSIYSYGATGNGRNITWIGGANEIKYYTIESKVSGWVFDSSEIKDAMTINSINSTGYILPSWSNETGWRINKPYEADQNTKPVSATISFDANGGSGVATMSGTTLPGQVYIKPFHKMIGWNTKADGTGTSYSFGDSTSKISLSDGSEVVLYAQWKPIYDDDLYLPTDNYYKVYKPGELFTKNIDSDITLYAYWEDKPSITISYEFEDPFDHSIQYNTRKSNNEPYWTNKNVTVHVSVADNESGLYDVYLLNPKGNAVETAKYHNHYYDQHADNFDWVFDHNYTDGYKIVVYDRFGISSSVMLDIPNIDKEAPKINGLECKIYHQKPIPISIADVGLSGIKTWDYTVTTIDYETGENTETKVFDQASLVQSIYFDPKFSTAFKVEINATDNANNQSYWNSEDACQGLQQPEYRVEYKSEYQLVDYDYVFSRYDEKYGADTPVTQYIATEFINYLLNDDNAASTSAYNFIRSKMKNGMSEKDALKSFMDVYLYNLRGNKFN